MVALPESDLVTAAKNYLAARERLCAALRHGLLSAEYRAALAECDRCAESLAAEVARAERPAARPWWKRVIGRGGA